MALWQRQDEEEFSATQSGTDLAKNIDSASEPVVTPAIFLENGEGGELEEEGDVMGWDDNAQAELDAFLDGSSDVGETVDGRTDIDR